MHEKSKSKSPNFQNYKKNKISKKRSQSVINNVKN